MEFILRPLQKTDAVSFAKYGNNQTIASHLRDGFPYPYTQEDAESFIQAMLEQSEESSVCRAIVVNGESVGCIAVTLEQDIYRKSAEIGYWLGEPFWGVGIMSEALRRICQEAFEQYDIVRLFATPFAFNYGSCRVLEKAGFSLEGTMRKNVYKNGQYHDSKLYALIKE